MTNAKRLLTLALIFALGLATIFNNPLYAATTSTGNTELSKELSLNIPDTTQDPNYPVTFIDPGKKGVDITIDGKTTSKAQSPFLLPNLAIGMHDIVFKFTKKDGIVGLLSTKIMIVPKAPVFDQTLKTVVVRPGQASIKGTALPQSSVLIVVNSDKTYKITASAAGIWELIVPDQQQGTNNVIAFTIKDGIVSEPSKMFSYQYKLQEDGGIGITNPTTPASGFSLTTELQNILANITANKDNNPGMFYGIIGLAVVLILGTLEISLRKKRAKKRDEKTIAALFGTLQKDGGTIVDVIQSTQRAEKKNAEITKIAETLGKLDDEVTVVVKKKGKKSKKGRIPEVKAEPTPAESAPVVKEKKKFGIFGFLKPAKSQNQPLQKTVESSKPEKAETKKPEVMDEVETEEPEKKILTKEEFLKQFQKSSGQDE